MSDPIYSSKIKAHSNTNMSAQEPIKYFEGINLHNPETYKTALDETNKWWVNFSNKNYGGADVSGITN